MVAQEEDRNLEAFEDERLGHPIVGGYDACERAAAWARERGVAVVVLCDAQPNVLRRARKIAAKIPSTIAGLPGALGEGRKRLATLERGLDAMLAAGADRQTLAIGVGGGVASDLFGFAAASYMRGIAYAHVATTLVAMSDAAIGGKTGVDLAGGKNLAGAFSDPRAVFCDLEALDTLPYRSLREGLAEVLKAAVIEGGDFFESMEVLGAHPFWRWPWAAVIAQAVEVKTTIVCDDRLDAGMRETLNLGHTFAHGFERASDYRITHGTAVALGLRAAGLLALRTGRWSEVEHFRLLGTIALLGMPMRTPLDPERVLAAMQSDKKKREGKLRFVLPRAIGDVEFGVEVPAHSVLATLRDMGRDPGDRG